MDGRPLLHLLRVHIYVLLLLLREAWPVYPSYGAQVLTYGGGCLRPRILPQYWSMFFAAAATSHAVANINRIVSP